MGDYGNEGMREDSIPPRLRGSPEVPGGSVAKRTLGYPSSPESLRRLPIHLFPSPCNEAELGCLQLNGYTGFTLRASSIAGLLVILSPPVGRSECSGEPYGELFLSPYWHPFSCHVDGPKLQAVNFGYIILGAN